MIWGRLRGLLSLLILQVARYENGSEEQMLQAFRQMEGYGGVLGGLNQLDDAAILKLLRENEFSKAGGSSFADALTQTAAVPCRERMVPMSGTPSAR